MGYQEIEIRSKDNVRENGEVFTPFPIVDQMLALIPDEAWADPTFCFLEPACGNGQILVRIFERRIAAGISIENTLNTLIGMDITYQNILDSQFRLFERVCAQMTVEGLSPQSKEWFLRAARFVAICTNNIFRVDDSIAYIKSGALAKKKFVFSDPTGEGQTLAPVDRQKRLRKIGEEIIKYRKAKFGVGVLSPFFAKRERL